jgi:DNA-binding MarR family transcriptional regulator
MSLILRAGKREVRLENRDFEVLGALEKWGALGSGQMDGLVYRKGSSREERTRLFFNEIERKDYWLGAYKRLRRLELLGLVRRELNVNQRRIYLLTGQGHAALTRQGRAALRTYRPTLSELWARHDVTVAAVGLMVSELLGFEVSSERERYERSWLNSSGRKEKLLLPDLWIPSEAQPKAIEVELTPKSKKRYRDLWASYREILPANCVVLYLIGWSWGLEWLIRLAREWGHNFIYFAELEGFRKEFGRRVFLRQTPGGGYADFSLTAQSQEVGS